MNARNHPYQLVGGRTCLDFLNTANWSADGDIVEEKLTSDDDVVAWCRAADLKHVTGQRGRLAEIHTFRAALRKLVLAAARDTAPSKKDLTALNGALASLPAATLQTSSETGVTLSSRLTLDQAVALSAISVLSQHAEISRVKICPGNDCAWLFLDESKNRRRTWCSMETCGNRAKAQRHYQRKSKLRGHNC